MPTTTEKLLNTVQALPEPLLAEVLDFAEFLRARRASAAVQKPGSHDLMDLCGGLEGSSTFDGAPQDIQRRLRDEWH